MLIDCRRLFAAKQVHVSVMRFCGVLVPLEHTGKLYMPGAWHLKAEWQPWPANG